jgi:hypothetical protein
MTLLLLSRRLCLEPRFLADPALHQRHAGTYCTCEQHTDVKLFNSAGRNEVHVWLADRSSIVEMTLLPRWPQSRTRSFVKMTIGCEMGRFHRQESHTKNKEQDHPLGPESPPNAVRLRTSISLCMASGLPCRLYLDALETILIVLHIV